MTTVRDVRICFFGDSFVNGVLDDTFQGWPGRICAAASTPARPITLYNLGIRRDTSEHVEVRWVREAEARLSEGVDGRLVFSFGVNDCARKNGSPRVAPARSLEAAARIFTLARLSRPVLWVGPPPVSPKSKANDDERVRTLSARYAELGLDVPFLDLYGALRDEPEWSASVARGDGAHPDEHGYALIADVVTRWQAWSRWWIDVESGRG